MDEDYSIDALMGKLGDFGKYQGFQFFLHILSAVTAGMHMLSLVTVAAVPSHRCAIPSIDYINGTLNTSASFFTSHYIPKLLNGENDSCHVWNSDTNTSEACTAWIYDNQYYKTSRAIEWNFVCDNKWRGAVAQSAYMLGVLTGAIVLGSLADKYGRKPIFCISAVLQLILGVGVAFIPEYYSFVFIRYLYGIFGSAGSYITGFVLTMELVGPSKRSICGVSFQAAFALGIMLVAGWGSFIKDRQLLQVIYGLHALTLIPHIWIMDESPRWLWSNGKFKKSVTIVQKALKLNGRGNHNLDVAEYVSKGAAERRTQPAENAGVADLFKTPNLRTKTLNVCLCWFANSIVYYGLSLSTGSMKGNPYLIMFLIGAIELPSYVICVYLMDRLGRRSLTAFCMLIGGICCIVATNLTKGSTEALVLVMGGKFLIASSFAIIYNYSAELFPTVVRNSAMGLGSMAARLSGAMSPILLMFDSLDPRLPSTLFGVISLISGTWVLFLPETLNKPMPQSLDDGEQFGKGDTFFSTVCRKNNETPTEQPMTTKPVSEQQQPLK